MGVLVIVTWVVTLVVSLALLVFALWLWRRHELVSAGWLALYWILGSGLGQLAGLLRRHVIDSFQHGGPVPFGWTLGELMVWLHYLGWILAKLAVGCIGALIVSDVISLVEPESEGLLGRVRRLRERHLTIGLSMVGLRLAPVLMLIGLHLTCASA